VDAGTDRNWELGRAAPAEPWPSSDLSEIDSSRLQSILAVRQLAVRLRWLKGLHFSGDRLLCLSR
jgi:hypothetical protein